LAVFQSPNRTAPYHARKHQHQQSTKYLVFFFFQAEDGIRDDLVTGVQTCALPICRLAAAVRSTRGSRVAVRRTSASRSAGSRMQIGRASCRERVWISVGTVAVKI